MNEQEKYEQIVKKIANPGDLDLIKEAIEKIKGIEKWIILVSGQNGTGKSLILYKAWLISAEDMIKWNDEIKTPSDFLNIFEQTALDKKIWKTTNYPNLNILIQTIITNLKSKWKDIKKIKHLLDNLNLIIITRPHKRKPIILEKPDIQRIIHQYI